MKNTLESLMIFPMILLILGCLNQQQPNTATTSTYVPSTSTTSTLLTTTTTSTSTTSTSLASCIVEPEKPPPRYLELEVTHVGGCMNTPRGKMNTVLAEANPMHIVGTWGSKPEPKIYYACGGQQKILFDWMLLKGGGNIGSSENLANTYRLAARCGRNQATYDLLECENLTVLLDLAYTNATRVEGAQVTDPLFEVTSTTTTTLADNPYLNRFRNQSLRIARFNLAWMCPSCVPAVNKIFMEEEGVRSQSLGYNQGPCYVVYDPQVIDLNRIMMLANAGGTPTLINDTEI